MVAASVAISGWFATYWLKEFSESTGRELAYIEKQLAEFYGPIFGLLITHQKAFLAARETFGVPGQCESFFDNPDHFDCLGLCKPDSLRAWIRLCRMDNKAALETLSIIQSKLHLLQGATVPNAIVLYGAHVIAFQEIHKRWEGEEEYGNNLPGNLTADVCKERYTLQSVAPYPTEFYAVIRDAYAGLKERQMHLRGLIGESFDAPQPHHLIWQSIHPSTGQGVDRVPGRLASRSPNQSRVLSAVYAMSVGSSESASTTGSE